MPIYRLKCVLRFKTGHAGAAFGEVALGAEDPDEAIALAKLYRCASPGLTLSVAVLLDETGAPIWSHRAPTFDEVRLDPDVCLGASCGLH
jgi:hypothetical protein